ncbi:hypothetical protein PCH_Pc21g19550 [Penicillium rubens Wisconsin 54-1255]|uniref:Uncharacterized protein n=1 Tax=Penicillium rubens (strain ATCC 28089 / DSM 1075 / NRRL 1951 / Wisconsin 54-1255) TaxID=500485 RepID=B6HJJ5_PENRW|nr:hypothetical protein PCH_Pc21g19550 [Penicillium rubens Wisconsin 54-1255]
MDAIFGDIPILSIDLPYAGLRRAGSFPDKLRGREIQPVCACTKPKSARYTEYMVRGIESPGSNQLFKKQLCGVGRADLWTATWPSRSLPTLHLKSESLHKSTRFGGIARCFKARSDNLPTHHPFIFPPHIQHL